jgi:adenylate kinase family enzyme
MRYVVIGTSESGKSTLARELARELAQALGAPYMELDAIYWQANWTAKHQKAFVADVEQATRGEHWVVDGNYSAALPTVWSRATHVVWLNFSRRVVFPRILGRTIRRTVLRETLWHGNRESLRKAFFSSESILLWAMATYPKNRAKYAMLRDDAAYAHLHWHELATPDQARQFLAGVRSSSTTLPSS